MPLRPVHRLDEPARLSLSAVASPQCRFRFAGRIIVACPRVSKDDIRIGQRARESLNTPGSGTGQTTGSVPRIRAR